MENINYARQGKQTLFIGSVTLWYEYQNSPRALVLDGQQRLVTITVIIFTQLYI